MEWVAISFSRGSSPPRDGTWASHTWAEALLSEPPRKPPVPAKELGLRILYRVSTQSVTTSSLQTCGRFDTQILLSLLGPQVVPAPTEEAGDGHSVPIATVQRGPGLCCPWRGMAILPPSPQCRGGRASVVLARDGHSAPSPQCRGGRASVVPGGQRVPSQTLWTCPFSERTLAPSPSCTGGLRPPPSPATELHEHGTWPLPED